MAILSVITATIMGFVAVLHFYWAFGGAYGFQSAGPTLEGTAQFKPGRTLTFVVATLLSGLTLLALLLNWPTPILATVVPYAGYATAGVMVLRAIGDFTYVGFFKKVYNSQFAILDTRYFSPLCLFLGISYGALSRYSA